MTTVLRLENFSYAWPEADGWTLRDITLEVKAGECHCLTGATGSGKSTLALAVKGLLPPGRRSGRILLPNVPGEDPVPVGLVMQNPETQLLTESVGAEVAFGLENLCRPPQGMPSQVAAALAAVGLDLPLDHLSCRLSMGQKYRLLMAAHLVLQPSLLILDEPGGQLDGAGLQSLLAVISDLLEKGLAVLLCEHRPKALLPVIDCFWHLAPDGGLRPGGEPAAVPMAPVCRAPARSLLGEAVAEVRNLSVDENDGAPAWADISFTLRRGERVVLQAPNGAGKTTLLRCLAGFIPPRKGEVRLFGECPEPGRLRGKLGYLFQNPARQLFETTVFEEVSFILRRTGVPRSEWAGRAERMLARCGVSHLLGSSPHQLSYGQKHLVALAAVLIAEPQLLLLDDPFAGLDAASVARVVELLVVLNEEKGSTLLWTSHDQERLPVWMHRHLTIEGKRLVQDSS